MSGEYYRIQNEKRMEQELKWLEAEEKYVQGSTSNLPKESGKTVPNKGK